MEVIDFKMELRRLEKPRRPLDVAWVNDSVVRMVACQGEGKWYVHDYDEFFLPCKGEVEIETPHKRTLLARGTGVLVPRGEVHRTNSREPAVFLVIRHRLTQCKIAPPE